MVDRIETREQLLQECAEFRRRLAEWEIVLRDGDTSREEKAQVSECMEKACRDISIELRRISDRLAPVAIEAKQNGRALVTSERVYRTLVETARDIIWTVDLDLRYTFVSPSVTGNMGYTVEEMMSVNPLDRLTPSSRARVMKAFLEELAEETPVPRSSYTCRNEEVEVFHKDGSTRWEIITTTFLRDDDGHPIGILGISHDITDRKRMEFELQGIREELEGRVHERTAELQGMNEKLLSAISVAKQVELQLRASEQRFRAVFETAQDCIFLKDTRLRYTHVNPAMANLFQLPCDHIIGRTMEEILPAHEAQRLKNVEVRVLRGEVIETEHTLTVGGQSITFNCVRAPLRDSSGIIDGMYGIARDVTERRSKAWSAEVTRDQYASGVYKKTLDQVQLVAQTDSVVLFLGESGTGKDYLSGYLHQHSKRAGGPFLVINCAALVPSLVESELFGHEAGAFTGSCGRKRGLLELAEGGTLLLNEIGELPPQLQAKLLGFLDTQTFSRVGGGKTIKVNTRVVAATNRHLEKDVESGSFRRDLFFRLNVFRVWVPPLRERLEDLPVLVTELIRSLAKRMNLTRIPSVDFPAMDLLSRYDWPGNVRELRNLLERALILSHGGPVEAGHINHLSGEAAASVRAELPPDTSLHEGGSMHEVLKGVKRKLILEALEKSKGSKKKAAVILGVSRDSLKYLMTTLDVPRR
jgi:PAS domain S-box-containing protein